MCEDHGAETTHEGTERAVTAHEKGPTANEEAAARSTATSHRSWNQQHKGGGRPEDDEDNETKVDSQDDEIKALVRGRKAKEQLRDISKKTRRCIRDNKRRIRHSKIQKHSKASRVL